MFSEGFTAPAITIASLDNLNGFFQDQTAQFQQLLTTGDHIFGTAAPVAMIAEIIKRNKELSTNLTNIQNKIVQLRLSTEQNDRDFIDTRESLPDVLSSDTTILDNYTILLVMLTYLILALSGVFYYAQANDYSMNSILIGTGAGALISILLFVLGIIVL
jgi:hypothetical protein